MPIVSRVKAIWGMGYRSGARNKFGLRPRAAWNTLKFMVQRPFNPVRLLYKPVTLMIEVSTSCNLKCTSCERELFKKEGLLPMEQVGLDNIEKLRAILPYVHSVYLVSGLGEPFTNPSFWEMVRVAKEYKVQVGYFSNAGLWNEDIIRKTFESGVNSVLVSVDTHIPEKYERFKTGAQFDKTIDNIRLLTKIRKEYPKADFKLGLNYIQRADNLDDMPDYIDFAKGLGVDYCFFTGLIAHEKKFVDKAPYLIDKDKRLEIYRKVKERAAKAGMSIRLPEVEVDIKKYDRTCTSAWRCLYIFQNGDVCPCPFFRTPRDFYFHVENNKLVQRKRSVDDNVLGNINSQKITDIWNGEKACRIRRTLRSGEGVPSPCDTCYYRYDLH